jgi:hypothetical protein
MILIFICYPPFIVYARAKRSNENAQVMRQTQTLLSRAGKYMGPIDGQCNLQTQEAIKLYKDLAPNIRSANVCKLQLLEEVNEVAKHHCIGFY